MDKSKFSRSSSPCLRSACTRGHAYKYASSAVRAGSGGRFSPAPRLGYVNHQAPGPGGSAVGAARNRFACTQSILRSCATRDRLARRAPRGSPSLAAALAKTIGPPSRRSTASSTTEEAVHLPRTTGAARATGPNTRLRAVEATASNGIYHTRMLRLAAASGFVELSKRRQKSSSDSSERKRSSGTSCLLLKCAATLGGSRRTQRRLSPVAPSAARRCDVVRVEQSLLPAMS
mmetsp:Transcript_15045/g.44636  ORF Transcript_15045/g.44636 Transcript_15045/m.44636 type:complete len:232 (-) Transcript_15045:855-1550(-)